MTSNKRISDSPASPASFPPWMEAPKATHSSGFRFLLDSIPVNCLTLFCTAGILVEPPTNSTLCKSAGFNPASFRAFCTGTAVLSTRSWVSSSNFARVRFMSKCLGPDLSVVMKGRLILVLVAADSSFFAFSAASRRRPKATLSFDRSSFSAFLNSCTK